MQKLMIIDRCEFCINFDNNKWDKERCILLERKIPYDGTTWRFEIPSDCPLQDCKQEREN
jgi:hypothetical protein